MIRTVACNAWLGGSTQALGNLCCDLLELVVVGKKVPRQQVKELFRRIKMKCIVGRQWHERYHWYVLPR